MRAHNKVNSVVGDSNCGMTPMIRQGHVAFTCGAMAGSTPAPATNCNRCGNAMKDSMCENCRSIDAEYKHCQFCGRYAMHYRGGATCVVCSANDEALPRSGRR